MRDGDVAALTGRLRAALARQARAREELAGGRADEAMVLVELRRLRVSWWSIATRIAPLRDRHRVAKLLRQHAWRRRAVSHRDGNPPIEPDHTTLSAGAPGVASAWSTTEVQSMSKLIKKVTTVTEETFSDNVKLAGLGDIDGDLDGADEDLDAGTEDETEDAEPAKPKRRARR